MCHVLLLTVPKISVSDGVTQMKLHNINKLVCMQRARVGIKNMKQIQQKRLKGL